jgi:hypothetical protein
VGKAAQMSLQVTAPDDAYEQEADRVAAQVVQMPDTSTAFSERRSPAVQRRVAESAPSNSHGPTVQRAVTTEAADHEGDKPKDEDGSQGEESRCPSWRADPESISKRAAETYAQNDMTPPSTATVERIECGAPNWLGNYGCYVHFSDGLVLRVIVRARDIVVGVPPLTTMHPPPATPLCFYDYHCPDNFLVLTKRECKSAKPPTSSGPTLVGQRRAAAGASGAMEAPSSVHDVLATSGRPLDAPTRAFFEPRLGHDFSRVRIHADAAAGESAQEMKAHAYTVGSHIVFGAGRFSPESVEGRRLIAHELTHVIQQGGAGIDSGAVRPFPVQRQGAGRNPKPPVTETEGCDPTLQGDLKAMHQPALDHLNRAIASLEPGWKHMMPADKAAFAQFFDPSNSGQIDSGFVRTVLDKYRFIRSNMRALRFDCDPKSWTLCGTSKRWCVGGRLMWTCFGNLHVCSAAYKAAAPDAKIETIIHESVHNALLTTDRAYSNEAGFRQLSPHGTGFWGRVLNFLSNIPVLGILFRILPGNKDTVNNPDSYAGYAMQV